jgi:DNA-binding NtrC family response regulator
MKAQGSRIFLFSVASRPEEDRLLAQLSDIGYTDTTILRPDSQLQKLTGPSQNSALIVLLSDTRRDQSEILGVLREAGSMPVLGLFAEHWLRRGKRLISVCQETAIWPCNKREIDFRIGKLANRWLPEIDLGHAMFVRMNILGNSPEFLRVLDKVGKIIQCDAPVYIDGETGTGKELIARAIHYLGARSGGPFNAANCGAIPDQLVENEFFGHERGAYTDAREAGEGVIAQAEGGTLFLDEIETLSPKGQVVLLRFLEDMTYRPLGGKATRVANVRVITATNKSVEQLVEQGSFRRDLFYRINIMRVLLPPLRERRGDIALLAEHFIRQYQLQYNQPDKELHPDSLAALKYYDWPGNVRELENMLRREFLLADGKFVLIGEIDAMKRERRAARGDRRMEKFFTQPMVEAKNELIREFEQHYLCSALDRSKGNISAAARLAGKERRSFTRLLEKHALDRAHYKSH